LYIVENDSRVYVTGIPLIPITTVALVELVVFMPCANISKLPIPSIDSPKRTNNILLPSYKIDHIFLDIIKNDSITYNIINSYHQLYKKPYYVNDYSII
jgi:hypothetical protein